MPRRIPGRLMPHMATIEPYTGNGARGRQWAAALDPVRANFNPLTARGSASGRSLAVTIDAEEFTISGTVFLDPMDLPMLSRITSSVDGAVGLVVGVKVWDHPAVAHYLQVDLATV